MAWNLLLKEKPLLAKIVCFLLTTMKKSKIHSFRVPPPLFSSLCTGKADAMLLWTWPPRHTGSKWLYDPATRDHVPAAEYLSVFLKLSMEGREQQTKTDCWTKRKKLIIKQGIRSSYWTIPSRKISILMPSVKKGQSFNSHHKKQ